MFNQALETSDPILDIAIQTDSPADDAAVEQLLSTLDIEKMIQKTLHTVGVDQAVQLTVMITGDTEIAALNLQYRQQDKPTDVLSFPLLEKPLVEADEELLWQFLPEEETGKEETFQEARPTFVTPAELATNLGDIALSWPTLQRQANAAGHTAAYELLFLLCHGVLHLVGYDDQTEAGYAEMVRLQTEILAGITQES